MTCKKMIRDALINRITDFINHDKDMSYSTDGWDEVDMIEFTELSIIIQELIKARFRGDVDGDLPIDYQLVNRNKAQFILNSNTILYKTSKRQLYNLSTAMNTVAEQTSSMAMRLMMDDNSN